MFTESSVRQIASAETFRRGYDYFEQGNVENLIRRGDRLEADVEGSESEPYRVSVALNDLSDHACTCPYDWGGACKHIVAVLLAHLDDPDDLEVRPPLELLLSGLDRDRLQALLIEAAKFYPDLPAWIEAALDPGAAPLPAQIPEAPAPKSLPPLDPDSVRGQLKAALRLHSRSPAREETHGYASHGEAGEMMDLAQIYLDAGRGRDALVLLEAVTEEMSDLWEEEGFYDEYGEYGETDFPFDDLGMLWTEALLTEELSPAERKKWKQRLKKWEKEAEDYSIECFGAPILAAEQGWDYPPLQRVLKGESTETTARHGDESWCADELALARLNVLDRQDRHEEYLRLARAEGQDERCASKLARLGRIREAVEYGRRNLTSPDDALALAKTFMERGAGEEALALAEEFLDRPQERRGYGGYGSPLAIWLRDAASLAGQGERALKAGIAAFREGISLENYKAVRSLAGERWPEFREQLLGHLRKASPYYPKEPIRIYLSEGMMKEAMALADASPSHELVALVVEAAGVEEADWVFQACCRQFDQIADAGKSNYYSDAVAWLRKGRDAWLKAGHREEWRRYLEGVLEKHGRKYKLVPMLKQLHI